MFNTRQIGWLIQRTRMAFGLSRDELARKANLEKQDVLDLERGALYDSEVGCVILEALRTEPRSLDPEDRLDDKPTAVDLVLMEVADATEADFWRHLREHFPEAAAREGPPWTWSANPKFKYDTGAGATIRAAARFMAARWLAAWEEEP